MVTEELRNSGYRVTESTERSSEQGGMFSGNRGKLKIVHDNRATREQRNDTEKW